MIKQNTIIVLSLLLLIYMLDIQAQVTIGTNEPPVAGALLQLKEKSDNGIEDPNATKGLMLPRVALKDTKTIISVISGVDADNAINHTGLYVFNVTDNIEINTETGVCPGMYVWNGTDWSRLQKACCAPPVIKTQPNTVETYITAINGAATPLTMTASGTNLVYQWQSAPMSQPIIFTDIPDAVSPTYTPPTSEAGYTLYQCVVTNECGTATTSQARIIVSCGAYIAPGEWRAFMCYNLGADQSIDPYTAAKGLNGDYYQWGRFGVAGTVDNISGVWNTTAAPDGSWEDGLKTANDPCPDGWRIPSKTEWDGVINGTLNPQTRIGASNSNWVASATNFNTGRKYGKALYLPATGRRSNTSGGLTDRGGYGFYWSTTPNGTGAYCVNLNFVGTSMDGSKARANGLTVRCIKE